MINTTLKLPHMFIVYYNNELFISKHIINMKPLQICYVFYELTLLGFII